MAVGAGAKKLCQSVDLVVDFSLVRYKLNARATGFDMHVEDFEKM